MGAENFQNTPGGMLPGNLPSGPTSDQRTDAKIAADAKKGQDSPYTFRSFTGKDAPETYAEYLKRVSGLTDFIPLNEETWRKETGQKTRQEEILDDLGLTPAPKAGLYIQEGEKPLFETGPLTDEEAVRLNALLGLDVIIVPEGLLTPLPELASAFAPEDGLQTLTIEDGKEVVAQQGTVPTLVPLQTPVLSGDKVNEELSDKLDLGL